MCDSFIRQALLLQSLSHRSATGKWMIYLTNQVRSDFKSDIQYFGCCKRAKYVTSADLTRSDEEVQFSVRHLFVGDQPVCALIAS